MAALRPCGCDIFRNSSNWRQLRSTFQRFAAHSAQDSLKPLVVRDINKLLIANRGEIACRIIRTAKKLGIRTVAVYSDADKNSLHASLADEAHRVGPAASAESYLNASRILDVVARTGTDAVHPGYGFLSENVEFAQLCSERGVVFVGPPATAVRDMGIKNIAKRIMEAAGVPVVQGYHGAEQSDSLLKAEADRITYPVMIKAVRGGGGKGMRVAFSAADFASALDSARREAAKSFGNDEMILERFVVNPRHVEVQIFGDHHRNYVYLHERDCSVQRRHQKIIEEAPAPGLSEETRKALGDAAVKAAAAVNYVGAGTVEFIFDPAANQFFFMEMNTRLQVEHPITEMITNTDLVEWQLRVAQGEELPLKQESIPRLGHAFEARIYAEDPANGFMPGAGRLIHLRAPSVADRLRVETGVREGDEVSVHYDPMIAKLVVWAPSRDQALRRLDGGLADYHVVGLRTNIEFLRTLAAHREFRAGHVYTGFIEDFRKELFAVREEAKNVRVRTAAELAVSFVLLERAATASGDPFALKDEFRVNLERRRELRFSESGGDLRVALTSRRDGRVGVELGTEGSTVVEVVSAVVDKSGNVVEFEYVLDGEQRAKAKLVTTVNDDGVEFHLFGADRRHRVFSRAPARWQAELAKIGARAAVGATVAPMPGVIEKVLVEPGKEVKAGDQLVVMIAMKMEYVIRAPRAAVVERVLCKVGDSVAKNAQLVTFVEEKVEKAEAEEE